MFEDANLFIGLDDASPDTRLDTVEKLRSSVRQAGGELPVHNLTQLFQLMSDRLKDDDNRVALMSAELLCDLLNRDLLTTDIYFPIVLPAMFQNLANDLRRESSVYVLTTYVEAMGGADCILEGMVQHGLMHDKAKVREQTLLTLPTIVEGYLVPSASAGRDDYMKLLEELTHRLNDNDVEVVKAAGVALRFAQGEDKNFIKHVGSLGQATLDVVTAVFAQKSNSTTLETKEEETFIRSEFETKDTMQLLKEEEESGMAAVAQLDQLDQEDSDARREDQQQDQQDQQDQQNQPYQTNQTNQSEKKEVTTKTLSSTSSSSSSSSTTSSPSSVDTSNVFTADQQNEIDRIRTDRRADDDREEEEVELESPDDVPIDRSGSYLDDSPSKDVETSGKKKNSEANGGGSGSGGSGSGGSGSGGSGSGSGGHALEESASAVDSTAGTSSVTSSVKMTSADTSTADSSAKRKSSVRIDIDSAESDAVNEMQTERDEYSDSHGINGGPPIAGGVVLLVYGIIMEPTMNNLQNQSSWKLRASAIEDVLTSVSEMTDIDVRRVRPHVPELFKFLASLLGDSNFKISITTLHILKFLFRDWVLWHVVSMLTLSFVLWWINSATTKQLSGKRHSKFLHLFSKSLVLDRFSKNS